MEKCLTAQIRKAATSVPSNIAEGSGRLSDLDAKRFLAIVYGFLMATVCKFLFCVKVVFQDQLDRVENAVGFYVEPVDIFQSGKPFTSDYGLVIPEGKLLLA